MKKIYITFLLSLLPLLVFSQGENDNWYFGNYAGVNFSNPTPVALTNSQMYTEEASGTVSDSNGSLLFYTNGETVWNREHQVMQNGTGLAGHSYSSQQLAIAKSPTNPKQYYIFTTALTEPPSSFIAYTIVDMDQGSIGANGHPLGKVLPNMKNIPILDNTGNTFQTEAITLLPYPDGLSFWVLIPNGNNLYSYRVTPAGFNPTPVVSNLNISTPLTSMKYFGIKASPVIEYGKGFTNYLSISLWNPSINYRNKVLSFENTTGQVTTHFSADINTGTSYISEFNKNGKILYLGQNKIYAVNLALSSTSVIYSQIFSATAGEIFYGIQRNKNNDIYLSNYSYGYLSKINNPDTYGSSSVSVNNVYLGGKSTYLGLPQEVLKTGAGATECIVDLTLQDPETYSSHVYSVNDYIITSDDYTVNENQNITMKAGNFISLLPNTYVKAGATYLAKIAPCEILAKATQKPVNPQRISLTLDLDKDVETNFVNVYPNPASDFVTIHSSVKILSWEMYDLSGKLVLKGDSDKVDVRNMIKNVYLLNITLEKGARVSKKIVVK